MKISKEYLKQVINEELEAEMKGYEMAGEALDPEARRFLTITGIGAMFLAVLVGNQFYNYRRGGGDLGAISRKITDQYANTTVKGTENQYSEQQVKAAIEKAIEKAGGEQKFLNMSITDRGELMFNILTGK